MGFGEARHDFEDALLSKHNHKRQARNSAKKGGGGRDLKQKVDIKNGRSKKYKCNATRALLAQVQSM